MPKEKISVPRPIVSPMQFRESLSIVRTQVQWIRLLLTTHDELYGTAERIALLAKRNGVFPTFLQDLLLNELVMAFCRISDGHDPYNVSVTLDFLLAQYGENPACDNRKLKRMRKQLERITQILIPVRTMRNEHVGHLDYSAKLVKLEKPIATKRDLRKCLKQIESIIEKLTEAINEPAIVWEIVGANIAELLFERLAKAKAYEALVKDERIDRNFWTQFTPSPLPAEEKIS